MRVLNGNNTTVGIVVFGNTTYDEIITRYVDKLPVKQMTIFLADLTPKSKMSEVKAECALMAQVAKEENLSMLIVCIGSMFKYLTKTSLNSKLGVAMQSDIPELKGVDIYGAFSPNSFVVDPNVPVKAEVVLKSITERLRGIDSSKSIHGERLVQFIEDRDMHQFMERLSMLHTKGVLAVDIETFSLKFVDAGLGSISFGYDYPEGNSYTLLVDCSDTLSHKEKQYIRAALKQFFIDYRGVLVFHNASFDVTVLIYELFMSEIGDMEGLHQGIKTMCRLYDDTLVIGYVATNNTYQNELGLKKLAFPYTGNYAEDVTDITKLDKQALALYNATDVSATLYVYDVYTKKMVEDRQEIVYEELLKPSVTYCIEMQLTGLPIDLTEVKKVEKELTELQRGYKEEVIGSEYMGKAIKLLQKMEADARNSKLKTKRIEPSEVVIEFNPSSSKQVAVLLYESAKLPILDITPGGSPSVGAPILSRLSKRTDLSQAQLDLVNALYNYSKVNKILTSFIPTFLKAPKDRAGNNWLYGFFNVGGTVSGRLSSNSPNLQQIPATGSPYAKPIKRCFKAPEGWLFVGLDFSSLEDRISALTTKDKNKLSLYIEGYDGHCLRAYYYYKDQMPDIQELFESAKTSREKVEAINSISDKYPKLRQRSKSPSFALTYQGTAMTLEKNLGFSTEEAVAVETSFKELYAESIQWVQDRLDEVAETGYATLAFGLRLRSVLMHKCDMKGRSIPAQARQEGRTIGNALGQSWGLLNNRAAIAVNEQLWKDNKKGDILPCALIHDAMYFLVRKDIATIKYLNDLLQREVTWQEDPLIWHEKVKLGGGLSIFYPTWAEEIPLPIEGTEEDLIKHIQGELNVD